MRLVDIEALSEALAVNWTDKVFAHKELIFKSERIDKKLNKEDNFS